MRVDCHLHTVASGDAVMTIEQLAERVRQAGLDVVCITDHNVTRAAVAAAERDMGVRVIVGEEIRTPRRRRDRAVPDRAHPLRAAAAGGDRPDQGPGRPGVRCRTRSTWAASSLRPRAATGCARTGVADIIEVFNAKIEDQALNDRAAELAGAFALPGGAGSDAHDAHGVGAAYLEMPDFDGPASFLAALAHARVTGEFRPHARRYPRRLYTRTGTCVFQDLLCHSPMRVASRSRW